MSASKCLMCGWDTYKSEGYRRVSEVFEGIWYCSECCRKHEIPLDIRGDKTDG